MNYLQYSAGIRPFLSGLYYHLGENFDFVWLSKQVSIIFTYDLELMALGNVKNTGIRPLFGQVRQLGRSYSGRLL